MNPLHSLSKRFLDLCSRAVMAAGPLLLLSVAPKMARGQAPLLTKWQFNPTYFTSSVSLNHDGSLIGVGVGAGICVYSTDTLLPLRQITPNSGVPDSFRFSPDGKTIAIHSVKDTSSEKLELWNVQTGAFLATVNSSASQISSFAFSPGGKSLAVGGYSSSQGASVVEQWNVSTHAKISSIRTRAIKVNSVAYSRFGQYLAVGGDTNYVGVLELWNSASGTFFKSLPTGNLTHINSVVFPSTGRTIGCAGAAGRQGAIATWNLSDGSLRSEAVGNFPTDNTLVLSPEATQFTTVTTTESRQMGQPYQTATVSLWNVSNLSTPFTTWNSGASCNSSTFSDDASKVSFCGGAVSWFGTWSGGAYEPSSSFFVVNSATSGWQLYALSISENTMWGSPGAAVQPTYSPSGKLIVGGGTNYGPAASATQAGLVNVWDAESGSLVESIPSQFGAGIVAASFSADDKLLALGNSVASTPSVEVWDLSKRTLVWSMSSNLAAEAVAFSPKSTLLAVGGTSPAWTGDIVEVWDYSSWKLLGTYQIGSNRGIRSLAFSSDSLRIAVGGSYLASGSSSSEVGVAEVWDILKGSRIRSLATRETSVAAVAISPDGRSMAVAGSIQPSTGGSTGVVENWNLAKGTKIGELPVLPGTLSVGSARFSPTGTTLTVGSVANIYSESIQVFSWPTNEFLGYATSPPATGYSPFQGISPDGTSEALCGGSLGITVCKYPIVASPPIQSFSISSPSIPTWTKTIATVSIAVPAPAGGTYLGIQTDQVNMFSISLPVTVVIPTGATSTSFSIQSQSANSVTSIPITAISGAHSMTTTLTVSPPDLSSFTLSSASVVGGGSVFGILTLSNPPGMFDSFIWIRSSSAAVVVTSYVDIPGGIASATFKVGTTSVTTPQVVAITAYFGSTTKSVQLNINPH